MFGLMVTVAEVGFVASSSVRVGVTAAPDPSATTETFVAESEAGTIVSVNWMTNAEFTGTSESPLATASEMTAFLRETPLICGGVRVVKLHVKGDERKRPF